MLFPSAPRRCTTANSVRETGKRATRIAVGQSPGVEGLVLHHAMAGSVVGAAVGLILIGVAGDEAKKTS